MLRDRTSLGGGIVEFDDYDFIEIEVLPHQEYNHVNGDITAIHDNFVGSDLTRQHPRRLKQIEWNGGQAISGEEQSTSSFIYSTEKYRPMECCLPGELTKETARDACSTTVRRAIETAVADDVFGVLVDALPSLGKSYTAATIVEDLPELAGDDLDVTILTHRKETRNQIEDWGVAAGLDPHQLPIFDDDCSTAAGEHGEEWQGRVRSYRSRGISPGQMHSDPCYDLPCMHESQCEYVSGWEECRDHQVLVGHPTHAYIPEVVRDRIVIFDEDPGEAFRMDFDSNDVHQLVSEYLAETQEITWKTDGKEQPIETVDQLKNYRQFGSVEQVEQTLADLRSKDLYADSALVGRTGGHGAARAVTLSILDTDREDVGNGAAMVELADGDVAVYDETEGKVVVRRPPDLSTAAGVVGLDGTPILRLWEGRLGCPPEQELVYERVLCDECRTRYLRDVLGYQVYQTSTHIKPYASGFNVHAEKDRALIEAVAQDTEQEPAVITTRAAERMLSDEWENVSASAHYGDIKGTNRFAGEEIQIGVVIGSQHPGDHEIKRLAALNGDSLDLPEKRQDRGKNLSYGVDSRSNEPTDPYLTHFREHQVVQAIFRFGRHDGATVYVHTGAVPDWILTDSIESERAVFRRVRSDGEREVLAALDGAGPRTVEDILSEVDIAQRTVYDRLGDLHADGLVEKVGDGQPARWVRSESGIDTGHVIDDRWYIELPTASSNS